MNCHHSHHQKKSEVDLAGKLRRNSRNLTSARQAIVDVLRQHPHPLSSKEILNCLARNCCDLATIYRCLHLLQNLRLVKKFDFGDGTARYELIGEGDNAHHHHLVCRQCSLIVEISECFPVELEKKIASGHGFQQVSHTLEFFGICPACQTRA